jgi:decaprenylphospho-beta-D-ribofuranose 2-oxidase
MKHEVRSGWGRNIKSFAKYQVLEEFSGQSLQQELCGLPVGLGRSYGDSSLNIGGTSWTSFNLKNITISSEKLEVVCGAGVTIGELERFCERSGFFPPIVPGTEYVTIGGAVASNIHGKSHHTYGSFGDNLLEIEIIDSNGKKLRLSPTGETSDYFWATVGGMGLTGAILSAKLKLIPVTNSFIDVQESRVSNLTEMLKNLELMDSSHLYTVAWIDLSGRYCGRGLISGGNHSSNIGFDALTNSKSNFASSRSLPPLPAINFINRFSVRAFNEIWYRKPLKNGLMHYRSFLHPLDKIHDWNKVYGRKGFVQYQFVIPFGGEDFIHMVMFQLKKLGVGSFLGVLKRFGESNSRFLSFPKPGWTLAVDIPSNLHGSDSLLHQFDSILSRMGGRVYLTKDSRLSKDHFQMMYPEYDSWKKIKAELDPENYWRSAQGVRLGLC